MLLPQIMGKSKEQKEPKSKIKGREKGVKKDLQEKLNAALNVVKRVCGVAEKRNNKMKLKREKTGEVACGLEYIIIAYGIYV